MKKKITTFFIALITLAISTTASAQAVGEKFQADQLYYEITNIETPEVKVVQSDTKPTGDITIPTSVTYNSKEYAVTAIGDNVFRECTEVTSITISNSITKIGNDVFHKCTGLSSLTIPSSVEVIGTFDFHSCTGLTTINCHIADPTYIVFLMYAPGLPKITTCTLNVPVGSKEKYAANAIWSYFTNIDEKAFDVQMGYKFEVNGIHYKVTNLSPLEVIIIAPDPWSGWQYVTQPTGNIIIPASVTYNNKEYAVNAIGDKAFEGCTEITSVTIPNSVKTIGHNPFSSCSSLTAINVDTNNTAYSSQEGVLFNYDKTRIIVFPGSKADTVYSIPSTVTAIESGAFNDCTGLTSITIPESVTSIGNLAFFGCSNLTTINCHVKDPATITVGYELFYPNIYSTCTLYVPQGSGWKYSTTVPWENFMYNDNIREKNFDLNVGDMFEVNNLVYRITNITYPEVMLVHSTTEPNGSLIIPASVTYGGTQHAVTAIDNNAFYRCAELTSATIPNSVKTIGNGVFAGCVKLTSIDIPDSVTTIGNNAFQSCSKLTTFSIPNTVTIIGDETFSNCNNLTSIAIPETIKAIGDGAFANCISLTSIDIPNSVTAIGSYAFQSCTGLTAINCYLADPTSITTFGENVFYEIPKNTCTLYVPISSKEKYNVSEQWKDFTNIVEKDFESGALVGDMFEVDGLYYEITSLSPMKVKVVPPSEYGWGEITMPTGNLTIPTSVNYNEKEYSVTAIGDYTFSRCFGLTNITIPNSVTAIGKWAFDYCELITSIDISGSVKTIGEHAFENCSGLMAINVESSNTEYSSQDGILFNFEKTRIIRYPTGKGKTTTTYVIPSSVTTIEKAAFTSCSALTSITLPNSLTEIGESAFFGCRELVSITIPDSVTSIGYWPFRFCEKLVSINCHVADPATITTFGGDVLFFGLPKNSCTLYVPIGSKDKYVNAEHWKDFMPYIVETDFVTPIVQVGDKFDVDGLYYEITGLSPMEVKVTRPTSEGWGDITKPTGDLTIPASVTFNEKEYAVTVIGDNTFWGCTGLSSITIPNSITAIEFGAFQHCTGLTTITIPNSVTVIGDGAFTYCNLLTAIHVEPGNAAYSSQDGVLFDYNKTTIIQYPIGNTVTSYSIPTSVTSIQATAFYGCTELDSITIPNSVTSIGMSAFQECTGLIAINCHIADPASITTFGNGVFYNVPKTTCTLYVPIGSKEKYEVAAQWKDFTNIVEKDFVPEPQVGDMFDVDGLYYEITNIENPEVKVMPPSEQEWDGFTKPTGEIAIPASVSYNGKEYSVTALGFRVFYNCTELTSVNIPNSVIEIGVQAFSGCKELISADIPDGVKTIGNSAFEYCHKLTSNNIPNSVIGIGSQAFFRCRSLSSITIPASVKTIGELVFCQCSSLTAINVETGNTAYSSQDGILFDYDKATLIVYPEGKEGTTCTVPSTVNSIEENAFEGCKLTTLTIPNSVASIGEMAFERCSSLVDIIVEPGNTAYSSQDGVLFDFNNTTIIQYPIGKTANTYTIPNSVTTIGKEAFERCQYLTSMTIPESVTTIESLAFNYCRNLASITIPKSVTTIGGMAFRECYALTTFNCQIADPNTITTFGSNAFQHVPTATCTLYVPIGSKEKYEVAAQWNAFTNIVEKDFGLQVGDRFEVNGLLYEITNLSPLEVKVVAPNADGWGNTGNPTGVAAFVINKKTTTKPTGDVVIPNTVIYDGKAYNVTAIGDYAFSECDELTSITIPGSVTSIGDYAFNECTGLTAINCQIEDPNSITSFGENVFNGVSTTNCTLYVPIGSMDEFALAEQWKEFLSIEEKDLTTKLNSFTEQDINILSRKGQILIIADFDLIQSIIVNVYNMSGTLVHSATLSGKQTVLPVNTGTYIVCIGNATKKVIVK